MPTTSDFFARFPNPCFIETGSHLGDGIQAALDAGFSRVHSIELSPKYFQIATNRFKNDPRVTVHQGDSSAVLSRILASLETPATFWLDGHYSAGDTALGSKSCPLMEELDAIAAHPVKSHTILIDDMRCWKSDDPTIQFGPADIERKVRSLNSKYHLTYEDSKVAPQDILVARIAPPNAPPSDWLLAHAKNVHSQCGEDGILQAVFQRIPGADKRWAVEFGAWDGKKMSNTCNLITHHQWHGVFIEANEKKFAECRQNYANFPSAHCVNAFVTFEGSGSLDSILATTPIPADFDLLSIDIDGNDYHIWDSVRNFRPKAVVIEFNPTIPNNIHFVQPRNMELRQGSSLKALTTLANTKGYSLICVTEFNAIYVRNEFFPAFEIHDNSLDALHKSTQYVTQVFQLFDGTLVWHGCDRMLWHDVPIKADRMQVLPPHLRFLPDPEPTPEQARLLREELPRYR